MQNTLKYKTVFKYGGFTFRMVKPSLLFRAKASMFINDFKNYLNDKTKVNLDNIIKLIPILINSVMNEKQEVLNETEKSKLINVFNIMGSVITEYNPELLQECLNDIKDNIKTESKDLYSNYILFIHNYIEYNNALEINEELYFSDNNYEKTKELFALTLIGKINKINYDITDNKSIIEFDNFLNNVFQSFFLSITKVKKY